MNEQVARELAAARPLTPDEERFLRQSHDHEHDPECPSGCLWPSFLATLDAARLQGDPGLREALEEAITLPLGGGWQLKQAKWRKAATAYDAALAASSEGPGLDAAWAEAEAALPEGWGIGIQPSSLIGSERIYEVGASPNTEWRFVIREIGLVAALRALAARLASKPAEQEIR